MILVNLRSGEPFTAHLIVCEGSTPARTGGDAIHGAHGDDGDAPHASRVMAAQVRICVTGLVQEQLVIAPEFPQILRELVQRLILLR
jgi:hypothetical protein